MSNGIYVEEIETVIFPEQVGHIWRTECAKKSKPHGVVVTAASYDRRAYFDTERKRERALKAVCQAVGVYLEPAPDECDCDECE